MRFSACRQEFLPRPSKFRYAQRQALRRGVQAGLTRDEIAEALTHLAFYAGWGKATRP